jgi:L-lactate dehydrogenase complex protein LldE
LRIALFITCLADHFAPRSGIAVVKVLEHLGHPVEFPGDQTCCGQPMFNGGFHDEARDLGRQLVRVFAPYSHLVTPSGSCAAMIREHLPSLYEPGTEDATAARDLADRTFEFGEFLARVLEVDLRALGVRWPGVVTLHESCHLRGLEGAAVGERVLTQIDGLDYRPLDRGEQCCGFGGAFAVKHGLISSQMAQDKARDIHGTSAGTVVSSDTGCTMNIAGACRRAGTGVRFRSLAEIIAEGLGLLEREDAS